VRCVPGLEPWNEDSNELKERQTCFSGGISMSSRLSHVQPRVDILDAPWFALLAVQHRIGLCVVSEFFAFGIPPQLATKSHRDVSDVGNGNRTMSKLGRSVSRPTIFDAVGEVQVLPTGWPA